MIDFKPIEEFTFDDCVNSIERHKGEGAPVDTELQARYDYLLSSLKDQEKRDYSSCKTIQSLEKYIKKYTSLSGAMNYRPQYFQQAKDEISNLKLKIQKQKRIRRRTIICSILFVIGITITIGYHGPRLLNVPESLNFSFYSQDTTIHISGVNLFYVEDDMDSRFVEINKESSDEFTIKLSENSSGDRENTLYFKSTDTFFNFPLELRTHQAKLKISQSHGTSDYLNVELDRKRSDNYTRIDKYTYKVGWTGGKSRFNHYPEDKTLIYPISFLAYTNNRFFANAKVEYLIDYAGYDDSDWIKIWEAARGGFDDNISEINLEIKPNHSWRNRRAKIIIYDREAIHTSEIIIIQDSNPESEPPAE